MLLALRIGFVLLFASATIAPAVDGPPAPPTTQQVQERTAQIQQWFNQLNDSSAEVRETARYELMGLNRSELTLLKSVVRAATDIAPAQSSALHEIVIHVYLAGEPRAEEPNGFLGLSWSGFDRGFRNGNPPAELMIGCVAYRVLQEGDEIVGLLEKKLFGDISAQDFREAIRTFRPGDTIHLIVLRRGQLKQLALQLDARPADITTFDVNGVQRLQPAEDLWESDFVPLLQERTM